MAQGLHKMPIVSEKRCNDFWGRVKITANSDKCWEWGRNCNDKGYGYYYIGEKSQGIAAKYKAHRLAYFLHYKKDPEHLIVQHKCDNPKCCNPFHLELGTDKTNSDDKISKGRHANGEKNGHAILTEKEVLEIRKLHLEGISYNKISEIYNMKPNHIACIVLKRIWKHI